MARVLSAPGAALRAEEIGDPARNRRRRIDEVHRPRRKLPQSGDQQRIMGAGEDDGVGARAIVAEARRDLREQRLVAHRRAGKLRLGVGG
jgi:hypothetical protein